MPILFGRNIPDIESASLLRYNLRVLVDNRPEDAAIGRFLVDLSCLCEYLQSVNGASVRIEAIMTSHARFNYPSGLTIAWLDSLMPEPRAHDDILRLAAMLDADILATQSKTEVVARVAPGPEKFVICDFPECLAMAEFFVRGHEIPWSFRQPLWTMPWTCFYGLTDPFTQKLHEEFARLFQGTCAEGRLLELARSWLLNRSDVISHTRDKIHFLMIQRRCAARHNLERQQFRFEIGYYLSYYYISLWGSLDQMSRVLRDVLGIRMGRQRPSVANDHFVKKIAERDNELASIFSDEEFKNWTKLLRKKRHFCAHEGTIRITDLVKKESEPSAEDVEHRVEQEIAAKPYFMNYPLEFQRWLRDSMRATIKFSMYEKTYDDISPVQTDDGVILHRPLADLDWEFGQYQQVTLKTLEGLKRHLTPTR